MWPWSLGSQWCANCTAWTKLIPVRQCILLPFSAVLGSNPSLFLKLPPSHGLNFSLNLKHFKSFLGLFVVDAAPPLVPPSIKWVLIEKTEQAFQFEIISCSWDLSNGALISHQCSGLKEKCSLFQRPPAFAARNTSRSSRRSPSTCSSAGFPESRFWRNRALKSGERWPSTSATCATRRSSFPSSDFSPKSQFWWFWLDGLKILDLVSADVMADE